MFGVKGTNRSECMFGATEVCLAVTHRFFGSFVSIDLEDKICVY